MKPKNLFTARTMRIFVSYLFLALLPFAAASQVVPLFSVNSQVQNFIDFKSNGLFGGTSLRIPLPAGNWNVRFVEPAKSVGSAPVEGVRVFLDNIVQKKCNPVYYSKFILMQTKIGKLGVVVLGH